MERGIITITENGAVAMPTAPVWMTQQEMSDAFNVFGCDIRKAIHSIYKNMELLESETKRYIKQDNGINYDVYSLEMVIAVSFKLRSRESVAFRRFIMGRSRESVAFRRFIMGKLYAANRKEPLYLFFSPAAYIRKAPSC